MWPTYTLRSQNEDLVIDHILSRTPGQEFIDIGFHQINPYCQMVDDEDASGGRAAFIPREFRDTPGYSLAVYTGTISLAPGTYAASFRMKVPDNQTSEMAAAINVGQNPDDWSDIAYQTISLTDFEQADQYQDFTLSFTLDRLTSGIEFRVHYGDGSTDLYVDYIDVVREDDPALPVFAVALVALMVEPSEMEFQTSAPERFTTGFEQAGGIVLTPDEFMAALNPEFMIELATPILGSDHPQLAQARDQLAVGDFLGSLLTVREALKHHLEQG